MWLRPGVQLLRALRISHWLICFTFSSGLAVWSLCVFVALLFFVCFVCVVFCLVFSVVCVLLVWDVLIFICEF